MAWQHTRVGTFKPAGTGSSHDLRPFFTNLLMLALLAFFGSCMSRHRRGAWRSGRLAVEVDRAAETLTTDLQDMPSGINRRMDAHRLNVVADRPGSSRGTAGSRSLRLLHRLRRSGNIACLLRRCHSRPCFRPGIRSRTSGRAALTCRGCGVTALPAHFAATHDRSVGLH